MKFWTSDREYCVSEYGPWQKILLMQTVPFSAALKRNKYSLLYKAKTHQSLSDQLTWNCSCLFTVNKRVWIGLYLFILIVLYYTKLKRSL
jgi:hypothetical protein